MENLPSYQASFDDFAFHFIILGRLYRDSNKLFSVHKQHQKHKPGEPHGHPLDVSFNQYNDIDVSSDETNDMSMSKKLRLVAQKILERKKTKKIGEMHGHPLDISGHSPVPEMDDSLNRNTHLWTELKKGITLETVDTSNSLKKLKRIRLLSIS